MKIISLALLCLAASAQASRKPSPARPIRTLSAPITPTTHVQEHIIDMPSATEAVQIEEIKAHAKEVQAISKKKIACLMAASSITAAALTAAVTLTIHFTECK